jgi:DNA-binding transcriptional LysR family regulator
LNKLPFIDSGFYDEPRKLHLSRGKKRYELSPLVRARANNFQISKQYILQGLGIGAMPNQIICSGELQEGSLIPVLPDWSLETVDVYMIYPFQLSFSNLISAFYETALEIITQNTAKSSALDRASARHHVPKL